jgi:hypothetical protein
MNMKRQQEPKQGPRRHGEHCPAKTSRQRRHLRVPSEILVPKRCIAAQQGGVERVHTFHPQAYVAAQSLPDNDNDELFAVSITFLFFR